MARLFDSLTLRSVTLRNRIGVSPMCMYSAAEGRVGPFHLAHLGARALGGAGLVLAEASAVEPDGRISLADAGIWSDAQVDAWRPVTAFVASAGAVPGLQIAHAGRKAKADPDPAWTPVAPSPLPFDAESRTPRELDGAGLDRLRDAFAAAAGRALAAGFRAIEIHMAHGYLLHEFLSPLTNRRTDGYGGSPEDRMRFPLEVARAVRAAWPDDLPLLVRISATDWVDGGWDLDSSVAFARALREAGVDLVDCSSGGAVPDARIPVEPGYQVPFAEAVRREAEVRTAAVGLITGPAQADAIVAEGRADVVLLARELLRDPHWPLRAAAALGVPGPWPRQYLRGAWNPG